MVICIAGPWSCGRSWWHFYLETENAGLGWKEDHADNKEGGYLAGDEAMLEDFVNNFNRQQSQQGVEHDNEQQDYGEDEGLRTSEEEHLRT